MKTKQCSLCGEQKPATPEYFYRHSGMADGLLNQCRTCRLAYLREYSKRPGRTERKKQWHQEWRAKNRERDNAATYAWRERNKEKVALTARKHLIKKKYGISLEQYDEMLQEQGGGCAICGEKQNGKSLAVDHDHTTGKTRALLCDLCNQGIGCLQDDPKLLRAAALYVEKHRKEVLNG